MGVISHHCGAPSCVNHRTDEHRWTNMLSPRTARSLKDADILAENRRRRRGTGGVLVALRGTRKSGDNNGIVMGLVGKIMGNSWEIKGI